MHSLLQWQHAPPLPGPLVDEEAGVAAQLKSGATEHEEAAASFPFLTTTLPGTFGYFSSGWPVAYLIATVIFGLGLLIGSLVPVSEPEQVARQSSPPSRVDAEPRMERVGRITGMVDCRFVEGSGFRVQGSGSSPLPPGEGQGVRATVTAFILHPSSLILHPPSLSATSSLWPPACWKSPTTPGPKSFCRGRSRMKSNRRMAAISPSAN